MTNSIRAIRYKMRHFYWNKYLFDRFSSKRYYISYDYKHKALWFRTYKVASRTINQHLIDHCDEGQYIYASEMTYCPSLMKNYYKFAFVRNPEDRFISGWKNKVLANNHYRFSPLEHKKMQVLDNFLDWSSKLELNTCDEHLRTQHTLIDLDHIDFIGRFENFRNDLNHVANRLGMNVDPQLHHINATRQDKQIELNSKQKDIIREMYAQDYNLFYPSL